MTVKVSPVESRDRPRAYRPPSKGRPVSVRSELNLVAASGRSWWHDLPSVAGRCVSLIFAPIKILAMLLDIMVSMVFLSFFGALGLWWMGYIPDAVVVNLVSGLGDKVLAIIQSSGAFN